MLIYCYKKPPLKCLYLCRQGVYILISILCPYFTVQEECGVYEFMRTYCKFNTCLIYYTKNKYYSNTGSEMILIASEIDGRCNNIIIRVPSSFVYFTNIMVFIADQLAETVVHSQRQITQFLLIGQ